MSTNGNQGVLVRPRLAFEDGFTMMPNTWIRDRRIKWAARGLLSWLLSHDAGFEVSMELLSKSGDLGRDGVRGVVQQLEKFGYLERIKRRDQRGRIAHTDWHLRDPFTASNNQLAGLEEAPPTKTAARSYPQAQEQNPRSEPATGLPALAQPSPVQPSPVNPTTIENYLQEELSIDISNEELLDASARELPGQITQAEAAAYSDLVDHTPSPLDAQPRPAWGVQPAPTYPRYVPEPAPDRPRPRTTAEAEAVSDLESLPCPNAPGFHHLVPLGIDTCVRGCGETITTTERQTA